MDRLDCKVMPYSWGSRTAIARLTNRATPSDGPEAEMWMGAHPVAPSRLVRNGVASTLDAVIAQNAEQELGAEVVAEFGPRLPFLLKVLAAAQPLSLQAHPNAAQARAGFEDEEARGIPRDGPTRSYRDSSHKPELLCAIEPVDALSGFRLVEDTLRLFDVLAVAELEPFLAPLRASPDARGLEGTFRALMTMPDTDRARVVDATVRACLAAGSSSGFVREREWATRLAKLYPGDIGVVSALLLELVHLDVGDAIYLGAGNLHAYLEGTGIEIMASSDNVLRGGLTPKHIDVPELLRVLDFDAKKILVKPAAVDANEYVYITPSREFALSRIDLAGDTSPITKESDGPEILLVTDGTVRTAELRNNNAGRAAHAGGDEIVKGCSVFVPASTPRYQLSAVTSVATVYRARTNMRSA